MSVMLRQYHGGSTAGKPPTQPMAPAAKTIDRSGARTRQGRRLLALPLDETVSSGRNPSLLGLLPPCNAVFHVERRHGSALKHSRGTRSLFAGLSSPQRAVFHVERRAQLAPETLRGTPSLRRPLPTTVTPCFTWNAGRSSPLKHFTTPFSSPAFPHRGDAMFHVERRAQLAPETLQDPLLFSGLSPPRRRRVSRGTLGRPLTQSAGTRFRGHTPDAGGTAFRPERPDLSRTKHSRRPSHEDFQRGRLSH
jgi:hypothetical protein